MNVIIKTIMVSLIMSISCPIFGKEDKYSFTPRERYKNKIIIGFEILVEKKSSNSTQKADAYWKIGPENLPVTVDQCYKNDFEVCLPEESEYGCYMPCLKYGPQFLDYDDNSNKLYFAVSSSEVGATGIGSRFIFVGDLDKKEIKQLGLIDGPPERNSLSPTGKYIAFSYYNEITILNTLTGERIDIIKENIKTKAYHETHFIDNLHWINDNRFTFLDKTNERYTNKHIIFENSYDIPAQKIINIRKVQGVF